MKRWLKLQLAVVVMSILIPVVFNFIDKLYYTTERLTPSISEVTYSPQDNFILIACEVKSLEDYISKVELHYGDEVVEMKYNKMMDEQGRRVRYSVTIPVVADNVEMKIIVYDEQNDIATYIIER